MGSVELLIVNDADFASEFGGFPAVEVFIERSYFGSVVMRSGRVYRTVKRRFRIGLVELSVLIPAT